MVPLVGEQMMIGSREPRLGLIASRDKPTNMVGMGVGEDHVLD
jgi:hypothetical protein